MKKYRLTELNKNPRAGLIIAGDFNAPGINWNNLTVQPEAYNKGMCQRLIDLFGSFELTQLVHEPTRHKAILDLFCTNKPGLVKHTSVIPGISDHDGVIIVDTNIKATTSKKPRRKITLWKKANWDQLKDEAYRFCDRFLRSCGTRSVQQNWDLFTSKMNEWK